MKIWQQDIGDSAWTVSLLHTFGAPVWRLSWSITGNVLAVSTGDHKVTLWRQAADEKWMQITDIDERGVATTF